MNEISYYFPEQIWYQILQNLPSKVLFRLQSVCKTWYRLLTSQDFVSKHLNQNLKTQKNRNIMLRVVGIYDDPNCMTEIFFFYPNPQKATYDVPNFVAKLPVRRRKISYTILGSCNGLVCLITKNFNNTHDIILWNPSIRKHVRTPPLSEKVHYQWNVFGFGVNLSNGDFNVISIARTNGNTVFEVYSLQTRTWVYIEGDSWNNVAWACLLSCHVYLHGRSHWIAVSYDNVSSSIISFDMSDQEFREVSVPTQMAEVLCGCKLMAMTLGEKKCLAVVNPGSSNHDMWVMEEYGVFESWTNVYSFGAAVVDGERLFGMNGNNLIWGNIGRFTCYDEVRKMVSNFGRGLHIETYMDSLVLLEPISEQQN